MIDLKTTAKLSIAFVGLCSFTFLSANSQVNNPAAVSHYDLGLVHFSQGKYEVAMADFYTAAKQGEAGAAHMLMRLHAEGRGTPQDKNAVFRWTLVAAQEGMADAQYKAGKLYLDRPGVGNPHKQAFHWFSKAVQQGHVVAHYELAKLYERGLGVSVDKDRAHDLFSYAASELDVFAQQGDALAQTQLAGMYEQGLGMPVNIGLALKWIKRAAVNDYADAQFNLARMLAALDVERQRPEEALYWVARAVAQGHKKAEALRGELEHRWPEFASR